MENQLVWKDEFNIGVKIIDEEHQRLFKLINRLFSLVREEHKSARACQEGIKYFKAHAVKHFEDEETYMELIWKPTGVFTRTSGRTRFRPWSGSWRTAIIPMRP